MFFLISLVYSLSRDMKDALVNGALESSVFSRLKLFVLFVNITCVGIAQSLVSKHTLSKAFSIILLFYTCFFGLFALVYPFRSFIEPSISNIDGFADGKMDCLSFEFFYLFCLLGCKYTIPVFYIFSEMFGSIVLSFLFLAFANSILTKKQAVRFIPSFFIWSNVALMLSGCCMLGIASVKGRFFKYGADLVSSTVISILSLCTFFVFLLHSSSNKLYNSKLFIPEDAVMVAKKKQKLGFIEGLIYGCKSKVVMCIGGIVIAYSVLTNLVDLSFKETMKAVAVVSTGKTTTGELSTLTNNAINQLIVGSSVIVLIVSGIVDVFRRLGWIYISIAPVIIAGFLSTTYFLSIFFSVQRSTKSPADLGTFASIFQLKI